MMNDLAIWLCLEMVPALIGVGAVWVVGLCCHYEWPYPAPTTTLKGHN